MERTRRILLKDLTRFSGAVILKEQLPTPTPTMPPSEATATPTPPAPSPTPEPEADEPNEPDCELVPGMSWVGKASYYSEKGCIGCSANLIMANGQRFNETANTLSFMKVPLNSQVLVTNLNNGINIEAIVTDRGNFESLGRIADLSKGLAERVGLKTDVSLIKVSLLNCSK